MHDYILSCCSAADVTQEKLDAMDVSLLCNDFSMDGEIEVYMIGMTIGCHSGPGTVAVYFFGKER